MALIGLDIGTTGTRAVLFSESGQVIDSDYLEYTHIYSKPGWAELNPQKVWEAIQKTVYQISNRNDYPIKALCISCMGDSVVPVRSDGTPNYNGILAFDSRSSREVEIVKNTIGEEQFFQITGSPLSTTTNLCKILWLKHNEPEAFQNTWKFLTYADYAILRMGLPPQIDYSMASRSAFDICRRTYADEMLKEFGLNRNLFSEPVPSHHIVGEVTLPTRSQLGLPKGVKVVVGGLDLAFGVLGSGVSTSTPSSIANVAGTFEHAAYASKKPTLGKRAFGYKVICFCNVIQDSYVIFRGLPTAGAAIRWFRDEFAREDKVKAEREKRNIYDVMFESLEFRGGDILVLPYFAGSWEESQAKAAFTGLTLATHQKRLLQGIVEGVTHELRRNIQLLEGLSRRHFNIARAVGGLSKSRKWLQLKADITGKTVETLQVQEASALGAALLAGVATGVYASIEEAIGTAVRVKDTFLPRREIFEVYDNQHKAYEKLVRSSIAGVA